MFDLSEFKGKHASFDSVIDAIYKATNSHDFIIPRLEEVVVELKRQQRVEIDFRNKAISSTRKKEAQGKLRVCTVCDEPKEPKDFFDADICDACTEDE